MSALLPFPDPPRVPPGMVVTAIGDVHGRLDLLESILARIEARAAAEPHLRHIVVSLGDLVDRGPASAGVVERMIRGVAGGELVVLRGNHEQAMIDFIAGAPTAFSWLDFGGIETLESYGVAARAGDLLDESHDRLRRLLRERMPRSHMEFISGLPLNATFGDYFFVHAGARPGLALADQNPRDFLWIRHDFLLSDHRFEKKIVHGHTPAEAPEFLDNRINLDTRAYASGQLTAAVFEEDRVSLL